MLLVCIHKHRRFEHFAVLPGAILAVPVLFYVVLGMSGHDLQAARDAGLVGAERQAADFSHVFSLFDFSLVKWSVIVHELPVWIGMVIVVAFSSR
jgi:hypothetical protein